MPTAEPAALDFDSSASSDGSTNKNQVVRRAVLDNAGAQLKDANGQPVYAKDVSYDANGNATRFPGLLATPAGGFWDPQNRMTVFVQGDPQAAKATPAEQYRHDAGGMRWYRLDKSGLPRLTLRDGAGQALAEYTVSPASGGGGTIAAAKEYVPGFGGVVAERTWSAATGALPKVTFHHRDHLGSLRLVTDPSGTVVEAHDYYPFGGEMGAVGTSSRRKFTGHERDEETGLDYMLARYYPASLGRFLSVDSSVDIKPANPQTWNLYGYVRNNPVNGADPDGHRYIDEVGRRLRDEVLATGSETGRRVVEALDRKDEDVSVEISPREAYYRLDKDGNVIPGSMETATPLTRARVLDRMRSRLKDGEKIAPLAGEYKEPIGDSKQSKIVIYEGSLKVAVDETGSPVTVQSTFVHESSHGTEDAGKNEEKAREIQRQYNDEIKKKKPK